MSDPQSEVRISRIAGRYLVFDAEAVPILRRRGYINGALVGTSPQQPNQNIFLGLPIEIRPEEAESLVRNDIGYVVDAVNVHVIGLPSSNIVGRRTYLEELSKAKQVAQAAHDLRKATNVIKANQNLAKRRSRKQKSEATIVNTPDALFGPPSSRSPEASAQVCNPQPQIGITPTCSSSLISPDAFKDLSTPPAPCRMLCRLLQKNGYYITPGLRFGSQYSVYPGDPLRYHAHYIANQYGWEDEIPMLDINGGGRLATAVKKSFLISGHPPSEGLLEENSLRTFTIEWATM